MMLLRQDPEVKPTGRGSGSCPRQQAVCCWHSGRGLCFVILLFLLASSLRAALEWSLSQTVDPAMRCLMAVTWGVGSVS